jgi:subtilase family serine protease
MFFSRTREQEADLQTLLAQQQDRGSANYHRWLSPEEFADRFGLSRVDVDKIVAWLQAQGLMIEQVSRSRTWVAFSGTAQQVQAALRTELRRYAVGGETHFMMSREPSLPSAFAGVVLGLRGLDDFRLKPRVQKLQQRFTSDISGNHFLTPGDLATIYNLTNLYNAGTNGTGQKLAIAGQSNIDPTDVQTFRTNSGLSPNVPQVILVPQATSGDADPGMVALDIDEANLDVDWAGAVARNATILYVYSKNVLDAFTYIIDQNLAPVLSISYGLCEGGTDGFTQSDANILASIAQQANAKGITIVAPTGDAGAADCDNDVSVAQQGLSVDLPGALPYVTSVGGTRFSEGTGAYWAPATSNPSTALSYIPEISWNDTGLAGVSGLAATGGGSSIYFPKPSWQTGTGVPADGARDVPDISFSASGNHDGYIVCSEDNTSTVPNTFVPEPTCENGFRRVRADPRLNQTFAVFGGTSAGVPILAGVVTLLNQVGNTPAGQGNINPRLYALAASSPSSFHDITTGNNAVPYQPSNLSNCPPAAVVVGYNAGTGYDMVTGLGSINAQSLVTNWTSVAAPAVGASVSADFQLSVSPAALTVKRGACGSVRVTLTRPNGFAGTPVFTCSAAAPLTAVTCSVSPVASGVPAPEEVPATRWWPIGVIAVASCFWCGALLRRRHAPRGEAVSARHVWAPGFALTCLLAMAIGCGGGSDPASSSSTATPTSSYVFIVNVPLSTSVGAASVTVTGAIGGVTRTAQLSLTVN